MMNQVITDVIKMLNGKRVGSLRPRIRYGTFKLCDPKNDRET